MHKLTLVDRGTLRSPTNARDTEHANRIKINVITSIAPTLQAVAHEYEREFEDGKSPLEAELRKALLGTDPVQPLHWARMFKSMQQVQQAVRYRSGSSGKKLWVHPLLCSRRLSNFN